MKKSIYSILFSTPKTLYYVTLEEKKKIFLEEYYILIELNSAQQTKKEPRASRV